MIAMFKLILKLSILAVFTVLFSCKEECLDMDTINEYTEVMESWYLPTNTNLVHVTSSIGVSEQVNISQNYHDSGDSIWDDCDNATNSTRNEISYNFQNFPFRIYLVFAKQGEEDGFTFNSHIDYQHSATYHFNSQATAENTIYYQQDITLNEINYPEVLQININTTQQPTEIKTIYYAKGIGIVQIELNQGTLLYFDY